MITINQLIKTFEDRLGQPALVTHRPFSAADVRSNQADVGKARELLGWAPQVSLDEGITRLIEWYMKERTWASRIATG